jgi:hypothetical protein
MKRFVVDFGGEEEMPEPETPKPRGMKELLMEIICMIPTRESRPAKENAKMFVINGVPPQEVMIVKYRIIPGHEHAWRAKESFFAAAVTYTDLIGSPSWRKIIGKTFWWQIMYPDELEDRIAGSHTLGAIGTERFINPASDFEYFEVIEKLNPADGPNERTRLVEVIRARVRDIYDRHAENTHHLLSVYMPIYRAAYDFIDRTNPNFPPFPLPDQVLEQLRGPTHGDDMRDLIQSLTYWVADENLVELRDYVLDIWRAEMR